MGVVLFPVLGHLIDTIFRLVGAVGVGSRTTVATIVHALRRVAMGCSDST
jgi:hypothetical protein